jgi:alpha,alpha-trehalose phosphorylase
VGNVWTSCRPVIDHPAFTVEPWAVRETELCLDVLAETESLFALGNGHIGVRGNLDEGEPFGIPGTYLAGFYETRPLPYAEGGYGYPEAGQAIVKVTDGKIIRLLVEDEPFDIRMGELRHHERVLDLRDGVMRRSVEWVSPTGRRVRVASTRLVSFSIVAVLYEVESLDGEAPVVAQSELVANEQVPPTEDDPRATAGAAAPLTPEWAYAREEGAVLVHSTGASGLLMGAAMAHVINGPPDTDARTTSTGERRPCLDHGHRQTRAAASPREVRSLRLVRPSLAPGDPRSGRGSPPRGPHTGWEGLALQQRAYLDDFWEGADIEWEGDPELQQAVRSALFHVLQARGPTRTTRSPEQLTNEPGMAGVRFSGKSGASALGISG